MDAALRRRAAGNNTNAASGRPLPPARGPKSSSPESGEVLGSTEGMKHAKNSRLGAHQSPGVAGKKRQRPESSLDDRAGRPSPLGRSSSSNSEPDLDADMAGTSEVSGDEDSSSRSSGGGSDADDTGPAALKAPAGVILVEDAEERNAELHRLLRAPRYAQAKTWTLKLLEGGTEAEQRTFRSSVISVPLCSSLALLPRSVPLCSSLAMLPCSHPQVL